MRQYTVGYPSLVSCLLAAVTANRLLFRYDFLNLFSYLFKIKELHYRVSKTKFRFSFIIIHQPLREKNSTGAELAIQHALKEPTQCGKLVAVMAVYNTVCRKDDEFMRSV